MAQAESVHGMWSSRLMFVLAATGSAVGLGNIWRFPYMAGENGGGAFVLVYLLCIALIGIPIMMSEILAGREGRQSPINTMKDLASRSGVSPLWQSLGWLGAIAGFVILSFYGVIAGWAMAYIGSVSAGEFAGQDAAFASQYFEDFTADAGLVVMWQTIFMALTTIIVARGVGEGLEKAVKYMMPALFVMLLVLIGYSMSSGHFKEGLSFLFSFNFDKLTWDGVLGAMGQAFFTLSLGMGAIIAYGAYMPRNASVLGTATMIALLDTSVALMSGMVIFPLVFANGLEISAGPGLMFITLPLAFGQMEGGQIFGTIFFILVTFAAITSSISLVEPAVAWLVEKTKSSRVAAAMIIGGLAWFLGLGSALSSNLLSDFTPFGEMTIFDTLDYLANNIMLPLGGMLVAIFVGWFIDQQIARDQLELPEYAYKIWQFLVRFIAPLAVFIVFIMAFI